MVNEKFKFLEHTADKKFQAFGNSLNECFSNSAMAVKNIFYSGDVKESIKKEISVKGTDLENLLLNFLEELLILIETDMFILSKVNFAYIESSGGQKRKSYELNAELIGDDIKNYKIEGEVKAITYNEMFVRQENGIWICQVIVDV
jgi:SHS2 domain-containing protein